jgi:hydrogenase maturation protease
VAWQLQKLPLPECVEVVDFGIRSYDLVYALTEPRRALILVDAAQRGQPPGTVYLIEPDLEELDAMEEQGLNAHSLDPARVLHMARALGAQDHDLYVIGCEPAVLETEDGRIGLSEEVRGAVPKAINMIKSLLGELLAGSPNTRSRIYAKAGRAKRHPPATALEISSTG